MNMSAQYVEDWAARFVNEIDGAAPCRAPINETTITDAIELGYLVRPAHGARARVALKSWCQYCRANEVPHVVLDTRGGKPVIVARIGDWYPYNLPSGVNSYLWPMVKDYLNKNGQMTTGSEAIVLQGIHGEYAERCAYILARFIKERATVPNPYYNPA